MRAMIRRLLLDHPASIGETYGEHARHAATFGVSMMLGALACFLHALVHALSTTTGSRYIARLNERMILNRSRQLSKTPNVPIHPFFSPSTFDADNALSISCGERERVLEGVSSRAYSWRATEIQEVSNSVPE
jgi:hypothetical protein